MAIEIKKVGKNIYYRKDSNKLGKRKEKQEMLNISLKHFEKDMAIKYRASPKFLSVLGVGKIHGGIKRGEMVMLGAIPALHHENDGMSIVNHTIAMNTIERNQKVMLVGMEDDPKRINFLYGERPNIISVDDIPYNPMDEFDRPWFYNNNDETKLLSEHCKSTFEKGREIVINKQAVADMKNIVLNLNNNVFNNKKPYYLETKLEDGISFNT